jgi:hypothetical protein
LGDQQAAGRANDGAEEAENDGAEIGAGEPEEQAEDHYEQSGAEENQGLGIEAEGFNSYQYFEHDDIFAKERKECKQKVVLM